MGAVSVMLPFLPTNGDEVVPYAELVRRGRAVRLWVGQSLTVEPHQALAYVAGRGIQVPVGTAVTLMPLRQPFEAAVQARSLALLTGLPVVAGIGVGAERFVEALRGSGYGSPLTAAAEYVSVMRALLDQRRHSFEGRYFSHRYPLPRLEHPPVEIGVGVLRKGMAAVAGRVADAAITWLTPADYLAETLIPAMAATAERRPPKVITQVGLALTGDPEQAARAAYGPHLRMPHYVDMLRQAGIAVERPESAAGRLIERDLLLSGGVDEVVAGIRRYWAAGVDEVMLNVAGVRALHGDEAARADLTDVLAALEN
ncbi:LLM class flavin-dependent oxidoreductase [Actinosynnema sp. CS-041913]|uniref:LLM class flavin-dependent oxidoreductase n=1 Tax=Actinosynnema sp. CS-041913 TaxID=3239917 RepID=UPI003D8AF53E